ncbi:MAG: DUF3793 family protein, partial [Agathobacter sp.]|nr:DUF3793 family protein [Agathobacter sp.]
DGYMDLSLGGILRTFQIRYQTHMQDRVGFPHEMGLLLGYPVEDVEGFILHKGQNALYSGYWKVYKDVPAKKSIFEAYESAKETLIRLLDKGYDMHWIIDYYRQRYYPVEYTKIAG